MPATNPHRRERWWHDVVTLIIKSVTTLADEWIRRGGHF